MGFIFSRGLVYLQWEPVQYFNNKIICDLVEEKFKGIISILVRRHNALHLCSVRGFETMVLFQKEAHLLNSFSKWISDKERSCVILKEKFNI